MLSQFLYIQYFVQEIKKLCVNDNDNLCLLIFFIIKYVNII